MLGVLALVFGSAGCSVGSERGTREYPPRRPGNFGKAWNVAVAPYGGPSVFGYETDMPLRRAAQISVHTSPLAALGGTDAGGMNVYIRELACHLAQQGLPVDIFTRRTDPNTPEVREFCPGVKVIAVTAGPPEPIGKNDLFPLLPEFAEQMALYSVREGVRYDVVHAHYWLSGWVAELARRYWETPFVQMFHTTAHMKNAVAAHADRESDLRLRTEKRLLTLADGIIAANPDERADLIWRMGVPTERVCTIPPGVDIELFHPRSVAASRAEIGIAPDERVVLFVGRIDPIKGIDTLIDAAEIMLSNGRSSPRRRFSSSVATWARTARRLARWRTLPTRSNSAVSRPIFVSSVRNRKTSCQSFTPRPTSWPCRRATSPSGWSRSRHWHVASRSSPRGSAGCASQSTRARAVFSSSHNRRKPWPGRSSRS